MKILLFPELLPRGPYVARLVLLLPAILGLVYAMVETVQRKGPNAFPILLVGGLLAIAIWARLRDAGWSKAPAVIGGLIALALVLAMQMLPMMRLDWVEERHLTRTSWELMVPESLAAFAVLATFALLAAFLPSKFNSSGSREEPKRAA